MKRAEGISAEEYKETIRTRYISLLAPLFFPDDPVGPDIVRYFASLLRIVGMEDKGWDPNEESRAVFHDLYALMQLDLPADKFPDKEFTVWRLGLIFYTHVVEMDAPYEIITNLLRFRLGKGYHPNPFYDFLTDKRKKTVRKIALSPREKIDVIKKLSLDAGLNVGDVFDDFYRSKLRNAISHSDFIFTDEEFRCRNGSGLNAFRIGFAELDAILTAATVFIGTFFGLEEEARRIWGEYAGEGLGYDPVYKGMMEVLADEQGFMNGFKVHWPNQTESVYRRTKNGIVMDNCFLDLKNKTIELFVGMYARKPGDFSPLVEAGQRPVYTRLEGASSDLEWSVVRRPSPKSS